MDEREQYSGWSILELMGHRKLGGLVSQEEIAGHGFLRIDVYLPGADKPIATQYVSPQAVYAITPTTEAIARQLAESCKPEPVTQWELPERKQEHIPY